MTASKLAHFCSMPDTGLAARAFCRDAATTPEDAELVLRVVTTFHLEHVQDFEQKGLRQRFTGGVLGAFWLASRSCRQAMVPPLPRISPLSLLNFAKALQQFIRAGG